MSTGAGAVALVRRPSPRLAEGILTHVERQRVDYLRALRQWDGYVAALQSSGWEIVEVPPAVGCPDSVFVEDTMVVFKNVALHLKSAVTALPDGTVLGYPPLVDDSALFPRFLAVPEESGAHVVLLGGGTVLIAADCPRTTSLLSDLGYQPVVVDISEFQTLEGCVTCLSVRLRSMPTAPSNERHQS